MYHEEEIDEVILDEEEQTNGDDKDKMEKVESNWLGIGKEQDFYRFYHIL